MNIGRSQIQAAQRAARNRNLTERARQSDEAAFRRHLQQAAMNDTDVQQPPMPPLPAVDGEEVHPEDGGEDETFMSAQDRAINSPYNATNSDDGDGNRNDGTDYGFDTYGSEGDYAAENYPIQDRIMHFLSGNNIGRLTRQPVEIAVAIYALTVVMSEQTTNAAARNEKVLQVYKNTLNAFDDNAFEPGMKEKMLDKLYNAQHSITGARLYAKALEWRSDIRNSYMPLLPRELSTLASGTGLRDAYNKFILRRYKEANEGAVEGMEDDDIDVEPDFWLKHISMRCLLATMVHRKNKEIANDCSSQPAGATRDAIRANARASLSAARAQESAAGRESDPEFRMFKRIKLNKTQMEIISSQSDVISLQLKLFQENKETFVAKNGEDAFNEKITALLEKLPDPVVNVLEEHEEPQQPNGSP